MEDIIFGCSVTNKMSSGSYNYYLHSRIDKYAVIQRIKTDDTEFLFRVILQNENIGTVWNNAVTESYIRPDQMHDSLRKYVVTKLNAYKSADARSVENW